jgi:DNA-directed RNA polymerase subunit RPC12/RpoP
VGTRLLSRSELELKCQCCSKTFKRSRWLHNANIKRGRTKTFCSKQCQGVFNRKPFVMPTEATRIKAARDSLKEKCPNCGKRFLAVVESRLTSSGHRRRRKHCQQCDYRITTVELPEADAEKFLNKKAIVCVNCKHNHQDNQSCDFDLAEYMTPDAQDCNLFGRCS